MLHDQTDLPTGSVTFLFTDIEGSTVRWERAPAEMREALRRHDTILREILAQCGGSLFQTAGDSFVVAFASAPAALEMALSAQRALRAEAWPVEIGALRVRMAIHTGTVTRTEHGYEANHALTRQARLLSTAHADQILVSATTQELLIDHLPEGVELRDLGELRLKHVSELQRTFQVVASGPPWFLPDDFPPPLGQGDRPGSLPTSPLPFIGRGRAVEEVAAVVTEGSLRLTTLLGPGGIGKTRLALRVAERIQHHFADGAFFVDLAAITDAELVVPAIGSTLGLSDPDAGSLAEYLGRREVLLVLDNLEQVIDSAIDIAKLMAAAPSLRVLATSRVPLHLLGECEYPVGPLELPDPDVALDGVEAFAHAEAMELFVERATAARRDFRLGSDNVRCVVSICHRLDGIPLALLLAAARLKVMSPEEMLERLDRRLTLLTDGARDLPLRHQRLRDTIEWSYELLDDQQQAQFAHWSVFAGGFRQDAAQAIDPTGDESATLAGLRALVENSLLEAAETDSGEPRYRMLETIGEHGREKLEVSGGTDRAEQSHARFFLELSEEAAIQLEGPEMAPWSNRLEEEHDNLRAALARGFGYVENGAQERASMVVRLATALSLFWHDRGHLTEGRSQIEAALALVPSWTSLAADEEERVRAETASAVMRENLGVMAKRQGALSEAREIFAQAIDTYRSLGDERGEGRILAVIGTMWFNAGDLERSRAAHVRGIELSRSSGDIFTVVAGLLSLGNLERDTDNPEGARRWYEQALDAAVDISDLIGESVALNNLANLAIAGGELERARTLHRQALEIRHEVGHRVMAAESMVGLGAIDVAAGETRRAATLLGFASKLADDVGATFDPEEQRLYDRALAALRSAVDSDQLAEMQRAGSALSLDAAMTLARSAT